MEFSIQIGSLEKQSSAAACMVVGVFEPCRLSTIAKQIDKSSAGYISALLRSGEFEGKVGQTLLLHYIPHVLSERLLLIGCGKEGALDERQYKQIINKTIHTLNDTGFMEVVCFLIEQLQVKGRNTTYWKIRQAVETAKETLYTFDQLKSQKITSRSPLRMVFNVSTRRALTSGECAIAHGLAIAAGIKSTKDLGNMPPNICTSAYLASKARQLADGYGKTTTTTIVIGEQQMQDLGMNAYLAVGQGSVNESLMSVIEYKGSPNADAKPIVLVGKGLTFDTGGISIKPADNMDEMKYDMCGAATVYGVMRIAIALSLPLNIIGVLAGCENMVNGSAFRPGDVLTTLSGQTVEVLNTDAEGRLVLCDALTYVERFNPDVVINVATLTGACVIALGHHLTGLISNHNTLAHELIGAAEQAGDRVWRLPLGDEFQEQLESTVADMTNSGGRPGGAITAGCFLSRFARKYNWAHLDIAGTAYRSGKAKGATGRPVAMLAQFLLNRARLNCDDE